MREYGFSLTRILPYKDRIYNSVGKVILTPSDIKTSKYHKCTGFYDNIWNLLTFSLFYLCHCKFVDLMTFSFLQGKICAPKKSGTSQWFCAPEHARSASGSQSVQAYSGLVELLFDTKGITGLTIRMFDLNTWHDLRN